MRLILGGPGYGKTVELFGEGGDMCEDCWHDLCYHCGKDHANGLVAGCQIEGCECKAVWKGENKDGVV